MTFSRPNIIRPPSEAQSYFLPLTKGCSNNSCTFCNYYYGSKLELRDAGDVKAEIDALSLYMHSGLQLPNMPGVIYALARHWDGRRVFLQDGDALVYPFEKLVEILRHLNEKFPGLTRIAAYATPRDLLRRSVQELETLRQQKLDMVYMGVETGDAELLRRIHKRVDDVEIVAAAGKANKAGMTLSVTVILGLGGIEGSKRHAQETGRILTAIDPDYAGALTLTLMPGTPLYDEAAQGTFHPISPFQSLEELKVMVEETNCANCFFSSMHASNYLAVRGRLPQDKQKILRELDAFLTRKDPSHLRPEHLRGL